MILIQTNTDDYQNDVRVMTQAFYPDEKIVVQGNACTAKPESCDMCVKVYAHGTQVEGSVDNEVFGFTEKENDKKVIRNHIKRELYNIYSKITGKNLPWGTLTGIRPVKIPYKLLEEGMSGENIIRHIQDEYLTDRNKAELGYRVALNEYRLLSGIDCGGGYSLYVGIPFCPTTCLYCSFTSYPICMWKSRTDEYLEALFKELRFLAEHLAERKADSIYIGGGTPTTLEPEQIDRLLTFIEDNFDCTGLKEFTVEAGRPDSIDIHKLKAVKSHGIGRISINPQTMNDRTLELIGRRHTAEQISEAFYLARECGFDNINMDIILGLPGEGIEDVRYTLEKIMSMSPDNLTVHSLALKRAARLNFMKEEYNDYIIENTGEIMDMTEEYARKMGMEPYYLYRQKNMAGGFENVGYAKPGREGIYNVLIMEEKQSIYAAGANAQSKMVFPSGNRVERIENVKDVSNYIGRVDEMIERKRCFFNENKI